MPEQIFADEQSGELLATIVRRQELAGDTQFHTDPAEQLQLGVLTYNRGETADAHSHPGVDRTLSETPEIVHVEEGEIGVIIFDEEQNRCKQIRLKEGDTAYFRAGGRGWTAREESILLEIKQGPYSEDDIVRYESGPEEDS